MVNGVCRGSGRVAYRGVDGVSANVAALVHGGGRTLALLGQVARNHDGVVLAAGGVDAEDIDRKGLAGREGGGGKENAFGVVGGVRGPAGGAPAARREDVAQVGVAVDRGPEVDVLDEVVAGRVVVNHHYPDGEGVAPDGVGEGVRSILSHGVVVRPEVWGARADLQDRGKVRPSVSLVVRVAARHRERGRGIRGGVQVFA